MVFFVSEEQRTAHRTFDEIFEASREILTDEAVLSALGDIATQQVSIIDNDLYVPNNWHGVLLKPRVLRGDNHIPVFATQPGDKTYHNRVIFDSMHPRYLTDLASNLARTEATDKELDKLEKRVRKLYRRSALEVRPVTATNDYIANTQHITTHTPYSLSTPERPPLMIDSKPLTTINLARTGTMDRAFLGAVGIHELVHILQTLSYPVEYDVTRRELEAYHVGAQVSKSLSDSSNPVYSGFRDTRSESLDALRAYENQGNPDMYHAGVRLREKILGL